MGVPPPYQRKASHGEDMAQVLQGILDGHVNGESPSGQSNAAPAPSDVAGAESALRRAQQDPVAFAELLTSEPLWRHQQQLVRSAARIRCVLAGRQCGKSRTLAVLALHAAFAGPDRVVLVVSATEDAAKRLLREIGWLAQAPLLRASLVEENKTELTLSNGSRVVSVPASERQVRGYSADLLIMDEACFIDSDVIKAARYTTVAKGGRIVMASSPYGRRDRPFAVAYEAGRGGLLQVRLTVVETGHAAT